MLDFTLFDLRLYDPISSSFSTHGFCCGTDEEIVFSVFAISQTKLCVFSSTTIYIYVIQSFDNHLNFRKQDVSMSQHFVYTFEFLFHELTLIAVTFRFLRLHLRRKQLVSSRESSMWKR